MHETHTNRPMPITLVMLSVCRLCSLGRYSTFFLFLPPSACPSSRCRFVSMGAMIGLTTGLATKPVWFKYRANQFYPAWVHSFATALVQVPIQVGLVGWAVARALLSIGSCKGLRLSQVKSQSVLSCLAALFCHSFGMHYPYPCCCWSCGLLKLLLSPRSSTHHHPPPLLMLLLLLQLVDVAIWTLLTYFMIGFHYGEYNQDVG